MSYKTVEVDLENGCVRPSGAEKLPAKAHALLTFLDRPLSTVAATCSELAERWVTLEKLPLDEANAFANDVEAGRSILPELKSKWINP
jgi:hypothetical protein